MEELEQELEEFYQSDIKSGVLEQHLYEYLNQILKYELLPAEEQIELIRKYKQENDEKAFEKVVNHNLRLSIFVAKKFRKSCTSMTFLDLIQEANLSLVQAVKYYDLSKNIKPSTYIAKAMLNNIQREVYQKDNIIRKPVHAQDLARRCAELDRVFIETKHRHPTKEEIMEKLQIKDEQYEILVELKNLKTVSLNKKVGMEEDEDTELQDFIADDNDKIQLSENSIDSQVIVKTVRDMLSPKEYYIIYNRLVVDERKTLSEIGQEFNITRERVRQLEDRALNKLRSVKRIQTKTLKRYSIDEIMQMDLKPIPLDKICVYYYLKQILDPVTYYFIYTQQEKLCTIDDYNEKFKFSTLDEIKEYLTFCNDLAKKVFTNEIMAKAYNNTLSELEKSRIFDLDIEPDKKVKRIIEQPNKDKYKLILKK